MTRARVLALALLLPLVAVGSPTGADSDRLLLAAAQRCEAAHRQADALATTDPRVGAELLVRLLDTTPFPPGDEARALRADLHARAAELLLAAGDASAALNRALAGLAEETDRRPTALTAQLHLREGEAREKLGDDGGAVAAYQRTLEIARQLLVEKAR